MKYGAWQWYPRSSIPNASLPRNDCPDVFDRVVNMGKVDDGPLGTRSRPCMDTSGHACAVFPPETSILTLASMGELSPSLPVRNPRN
jgi:hypothetical protein